MKTDIEIAQSIELKPIVDVVEKLGISYDDLELYGKYKAKLSFDKIRAVESNPVGKLILVTAINPTPAGEGKSTITIGLADALNKIGKKTMIAIREPSLGPVMGIKGGREQWLRSSSANGRHQPPLYWGHACYYNCQQCAFCLD